MVNNNALALYNNYLKPLGELPKHISFEQYQELRSKISGYYDNLNMPNKRGAFLKVRDKLLIDFLFATGGRIFDVVMVKKENINFETKKLNLYIKKSKKNIIINLDNALCYDILSYVQQYQIKDRLFNITSTAAWYILKKFGKLVGINNLHPHMMRHGLALYLMSQGCPIPVISYRLGHSDVRITMQMYLKVTPEIENQFIQNIQWR